MLSILLFYNTYNRKEINIMTVKDAFGKVCDLTQSWWNENVKSTPAYQQVIQGDTYKSMQSLYSDLVTSGKAGYDSFMASESGQKAATMVNTVGESASEYLSNNEYVQNVRASLSDAWNKVSNADISPIVEQAQMYGEKFSPVISEARSRLTDAYLGITDMQTASMEQQME